MINVTKTLLSLVESPTTVAQVIAQVKVAAKKNFRTIRLDAGFKPVEAVVSLEEGANGTGTWVDLRTSSADAKPGDGNSESRVDENGARYVGPREVNGLRTGYDLLPGNPVKSAVSFDELLNALNASFGPPAIERSGAQGNATARWEVRQAIWRVPVTG